jgi:AraC family transcriptional regulator of adaptative response / DNA-3-methyladenine glycosylase II
MDLSPEICYRALQTHDARFDGRFFVAVRTTGIYCRPVCPAPGPKFENCTFVPSAAAAHELGYRPCLRCRPETSPGTPAWLGTSAVVSRALRLISGGALDGGSVDGLAGRLGVGERHLRRLFLKHLGAPPLAVARTRRVLFAKKLINETGLPMADVAMSSGFSSIRSFNETIRITYDRSPSELRREFASPNGTRARHAISLRLPFRAPFQWGALTGFLAPRATPGVEEVSPEFYRRTVRCDGVHGIVEVRPSAGESYLTAALWLTHPRALLMVVERLRRLFDLSADPNEIGTHLRTDNRLRRAVDALPGLRVPGAWDGFELAVRAVLGQQVSVKGATTLAGRIAAAFGEPLPAAARVDGMDRLTTLFPTPAALANADLSAVGMPGARAKAVSSLAAAVARGEIAFDTGRDLDETVRQLCALPGIGEWTAQYIAMRALGEPDAFPASDLGLRKALSGGERLPGEAEVLRAAEAWRPWRAYGAMYLWTGGQGE